MNAILPLATHLELILPKLVRYDESGRGQYRSEITVSIKTMISFWQMAAYLPHKKGFAGYTTRFWHPAYVKYCQSLHTKLAHAH